MAKRIQQFRYYGDSDEHIKKHNYPYGLDSQALRTGSAFSQYPLIKTIGICASTSIVFYTNQLFDQPNTLQSKESISIDGDIASITHLAFDRLSLNNIENDNGELIVDIVYEDD